MTLVSDCGGTSFRGGGGGVGEEVVVVRGVNGEAVFLRGGPSVVDCNSVMNGGRRRKPLGGRFSDFVSSDCFNRRDCRGTRDGLRAATIRVTLGGTKLRGKSVSGVFTNSLLGRYVNSSFKLHSFGVPFVKLCNTYSAVTLSATLTSVFIRDNIDRHTVTIASSRFYSTRERCHFPLGCNGRHAPATR